MQKLKINEIFYSLQGEGARTGHPSIFIRLSDCNLTCGFCDTEFTSGQEKDLNEILSCINVYPCKEIVWTGGEPLKQLTEENIKFFKEKGFYQCIETNGSFKPLKGLDFITLSPKVAEHILEKNFTSPISEIKYVRHKGHFSLPNTNIVADNYYISPQFNGNQIDTENLNHCINLILQHNTKHNWKLTLQTHKLLKIL